MLERRGIISGYEGSKQRRVLLEEHLLATVIGSQKGTILYNRRSTGRLIYGGCGFGPTSC